MSKLRDIVISISKDDNVKFHPEDSEKQIKALMLELAEQAETQADLIEKINAL